MEVYNRLTCHLMCKQSDTYFSSLVYLFCSLSVSDTSPKLFARCLSAVLTLAFHLVSSSPQTRRERVRQNHRSDRSDNCGGWEMWTSTFFHDPSSRAPAERQVAAMLYLSPFVFVVSRTFQPNIATCDRFFSLTHQETECLFNTSRCTFFLVVSIKNSGFAENKHTTSLLWDCVSVYYPPAVFACGNGLVYFQLKTDICQQI